MLAFSGGLDSRVLLQLLAENRALFNIQLEVMHVHHGLSPNADEWAQFCQQVCMDLNVPLKVVHVQVDKNSGLGVEAAARHARYHALSQSDADFIVLAHHQNDQAETLLLQLLRGAGPKGLAAMAKQDANRRLLRPLLDVSREELLQYAKAKKLLWIEDESNQDERYDRNFVRQTLLPTIEQRFKGASKTLARTAGHMAEADALLNDLAELDAQCLGLSEHDELSEQSLRQSLPLTCLRRLSLPRARNLLRWWLALNDENLPSAARLEDMLSQLLSARADAVISIKIDANRQLRRYQDQVYIEERQNQALISLSWDGQSRIDLPDGGHLAFEKIMSQGLAFERLGVKKLRIASREGGERFKPNANRPTRTLKHLLQEAEMPPWERQKLPLVYLNDELVLVPGIGIAAGFEAEPGELGLSINWNR